MLGLHPIANAPLADLGVLPQDWTLAVTGALTLDAALTLLASLVRLGHLTLTDAVTILSSRLLTAEQLQLVDSAAVERILGALISGSLTLMDAVSIIAVVLASGSLTLADTVLITGGTAVGAQERWAPRWLIEIQVPV